MKGECSLLYPTYYTVPSDTFDEYKSHRYRVCCGMMSLRAKDSVSFSASRGTVTIFFFGRQRDYLGGEER